MPKKQNDGNGEVALSGADTKMALAKRMLANLKAQLENLEQVLMSDSETVELGNLMTVEDGEGGNAFMSAMRERVVEGVFDGENMIGEDGQKYLVPPNYASKSKLVEGDLLRLTVTDAGRFIFKQKGPIERNRLVGVLVQDERTSVWCVAANGQKFCVLPASISYFKGEPGDDVAIFVPKNTPSRWAAVENVIKREME
jgi:hypothetical protein